LTFLEFLDPEADKRQTDPELTSRILMSGDTLSRIAGEMYGDPKLWRIIADANGLDNPNNLNPHIGKRLMIPKI
jgi:hypothetical protein